MNPERSLSFKARSFKIISRATAGLALTVAVAGGGVLLAGSGSSEVPESGNTVLTLRTANPQDVLADFVRESGGIVRPPFTNCEDCAGLKDPAYNNNLPQVK